MNKIKIYQVDAFSNKLFQGNPAAVCPLKTWLPKEIMQSIAMENNLSETVFFIKKTKKYYIRFFTPKAEIDLAGHPTLASAHIIFSDMDKEVNCVQFKTINGEILKVNKNKNILSMDFPSSHAKKNDSSIDLIFKALKSKPKEFFVGRYAMAIFHNEDEISNLEPDFKVINKLKYNGLIATAPGKSCDFVSRFFAPKLGILEDPVTGSAHCDLIPYWSRLLNKKNMIAKQLSSRSGTLYCSYRNERVIIGGEAITFMQGYIFL